MIGRLLNLVKCITKSKEEGEEEADVMVPCFLFWNWNKQTLNKQMPEDDINSV